MMDTANSEMTRLHDLSAKQGRRIAELEAENARLEDAWLTMRAECGKLEAERDKDREAMQTVVEKALRHDHLQGPVEDAIDNMARRLEESCL